MKKSVGLNFKIGTVVLVAWLLFSAVYIVLDLWKGGLSLAHKIGYETAYVEIIDKSTAACEPFTLFAGKVKVDLINMACLKTMPKSEVEAAVKKKDGGSQ